jgi:Bifunctional DNA primase/polymerase, N-terminal
MIPQNAHTLQATAQPPATNRDIALQYRAAYGWCALPAYRVTPRGDGGANCFCYAGRNCDKPGKHPIGKWGWEALPACPTYEELYARWGNGRHNNIAILTGSRSGVVVADIDPRHGGNLDTLLDAGWTLDTCIARSGGGGLHVYARMPQGVDRVASLDAYLPGIELKADGTLVIAPPSGHASGKEYAWALGHEPDALPPAELPQPVWDAIFHRPESRRAPPENMITDPDREDPNALAYPLEETREWATRLYYKAIRKARAGDGRNNTAYWLGRQLDSLGMMQSEIVKWVLAYGSEVRNGQH